MVFGEMETGWKLLTEFGTTGMFCLLLWKLADKWLGSFLKASQDQTAAMTSQAVAITNLANNVSAGQTDQHEVLLAVRVQSREMREMKDLLERIAAATEPRVREMLQQVRKAE
jgi:hypothetical protein